MRIYSMKMIYLHQKYQVLYQKNMSCCRKPGQGHETGYVKTGWPAGLPGKPGGAPRLRGRVRRCRRRGAASCRSVSTDRLD